MWHSAHHKPFDIHFRISTESSLISMGISNLGWSCKVGRSNRSGATQKVSNCFINQHCCTSLITISHRLGQHSVKLPQFFPIRVSFGTWLWFLKTINKLKIKRLMQNGNRYMYPNVHEAKGGPAIGTVRCSLVYTPTRRYSIPSIPIPIPLIAPRCYIHLR